MRNPTTIAAVLLAAVPGFGETLRVASEYPTTSEAIEAWETGDSILIEAGATGGLVLGCGEVLAAPFEFTGIGTQRLFLNGLQYQPPRRSSEKVVVTPERKAAGEAVDETIERAYRAIEDVPEEERPQALARIVEESGLANSVEVRGRYVLVYWRAFPEVRNSITVDVDPAFLNPPEKTPEWWMVFHRHAIDEFWRITRSGGFVSFGDHFTRGMTPGIAENTRAVLKELDRGHPLDEDRYEGTALEVEQVRRSVLEARGLANE